MALWRAEALKRLPELREAIDSSNGIMALWIEIGLIFQEAYSQNPPDESLISRVYSFADWCEKARRGPDAGHDPSTAVALCFYEHLPTWKGAREDMPRWVRFDDLAKNRQLFSYLIGEQGYHELVSYMARNRHKYVPRPSQFGEP